MTWRRGAFWALVVMLVTPALVLTVLRLSDPRRSLLIRAQSLAPYAIGLYAVVLVLLAAWALRHRRQAWVVLLPLLGLGLHAYWLAPLYTGSTRPPAPGATPWVVMTLNLESVDASATPVVRTVEEHHVDVLVLEDATADSVAVLDRAGLSDLLPHRASVPGEGGIVVLSRAEVGAAEAQDPVDRVVLTTIETGSGSLRLLAVHPEQPTHAADWRADHARLLAAVRSQQPDLIVGDFNATLDQAPLRRLEDLGYRTATELANQGWQPTWPANGLYHALHLVPMPPLVQIDQVVLGAGLTATGTTTVPITGTDHRALVATLATAASG